MRFNALVLSLFGTAIIIVGCAGGGAHSSLPAVSAVSDHGIHARCAAEVPLAGMRSTRTCASGDQTPDPNATFPPEIGSIYVPCGGGCYSFSGSGGGGSYARTFLRHVR